MSKYISLKVPGARKEEEFVVYPMGKDEQVAKLQSNNRCVVVNLTSKKMHVGKRVAQYPRFESVQPQYGGTVHDAPQSLVDAINERRTGSTIVTLL